MIRQSVKLDLPNIRIICTLPVRGQERDFLSTNRDRALKVLDQQCKKYHKDDEVKEVAIKAFKKLFDNGHAALVDDVDEEICRLNPKRIDTIESFYSSIQTKMQHQFSYTYTYLLLKY